MRINLSKITHFYKTDLGHYAFHALNARITSLFDKREGQSIVASGGSSGYVVDLVQDQDKTRFAFQIFSTENHSDCSKGTGHYVLIDREAWPYRAEEIDLAFMIHDLEFAENPDVYLREAWRVLKGEGKIILVVPNRSGRWARIDNTPFGQGYPYTFQQIKKLVESAHFTITKCESCLFFPPYQPKTKIGLLYRRLFDFFGQYCFLPGGVLVLELQKHIYSPSGGLRIEASQRAKKILFPKTAVTGRS